MITQRHYDEAAAMIQSAYKPHAMKRSAQYQGGMLAAVAWCLADRPRGELTSPPYSEGSAELDAWLSGIEAGKRLAAAEVTP